MHPVSLTRSIRMACAAIGVLAYASAVAHIKNEATQFPDIEFSDARFDIVVLVGAGIIPETPVFEPDRALTKKDLASWIALTEGLAPGGETPDVDALAAAALDKDLVSSLDGDASIADVNRLFFAGQLDVKGAAGAPSKAEAASLIAGALNTAAGAGLLEKRRLAAGGTGAVSDVTIQKGHHGDAYVMTIGEVTLPMDEHGRVANGPTDLLQWQDRRVIRSFVRGSGDHAHWLYLEAEPREVAQPAEVMATTITEAPAVETPPADRSLLYWLVAAVVLLGVALFFKRRQSD